MLLSWVVLNDRDIEPRLSRERGRADTPKHGEWELSVVSSHSQRRRGYAILQVIATCVWIVNVGVTAAGSWRGCLQGL